MNMERSINKPLLYNRYKKHQAFILSVFFHGAFLYAVIVFSPRTPLKTTLVHHIIHAKLYTPPIISFDQKETTQENPTLNKEVISTNTIIEATKIKDKAIIKENVKAPIITSAESKGVEDIKKVPSKFLSDPMSTLEKLTQKMYDKAMNESAIESYQQYIRDKNTISQSKTKYKQLPEAKALKVEVNCDNTLNKGLTLLSNLLGGSVKCNSFNGSQKFIDARLKKMGKSKKKN